MRDVGALLSAWNGFYVLIGSAAGALTGLVFVVITLIRDRETAQSEEGVAAFTTPTVLHFSCALFVAAVLSAPFRSFVPLAILLGSAGIFGVVYVTRVAVKQSKLEKYEPDVEDRVWHVILPLVAYAALAGGSLALVRAPSQALFAPASAVTLLIFIGIHNAWDLVTFLATGKADELPTTSEKSDADRTPDEKTKNG